MESLHDVLSVIVTTSPVPHNPSTEMIERTFESFKYAEGVNDCPKIIVCDGANVRIVGTGRRSRMSYRQGAHVSQLIYKRSLVCDTNLSPSRHKQTETVPQI
jgi:hypothetical protein